MLKGRKKKRMTPQGSGKVLLYPLDHGLLSAKIQEGSLDPEASKVWT